MSLSETFRKWLSRDASATRSARAARPARPDRPQAGELTAAQRTAGIAAAGALPGWSPRGGEIATYRMMSAHPTIALAISMVKAPIVSNAWTLHSRDASVPAEWPSLVAAQINPLLRDLKRDALRALEFGFYAFEKIWVEHDGRLELARLKPLLPDPGWTEILVDGGGGFAGVRAVGRDGRTVDLPPRKSCLFSNDAEAGNLLGKSRHENVRRRWNEWELVAAKAARYQTKVANILTQIHYPDGTSKDAAGADRPNYWLAQTLAASIADGKTIAVPNFFHNSSDPRLSAELAGKSAWIIDFKDSGGADHAGGFIDYLRYLDALLFRGWLRPERTGLESQHGTRSDAQTHTDSAVLDCEMIEAELFGQINRQIIDDILVLNFGAAAAGSVYAEPAPIADDKAQVNRDILARILATPAGFEAFARYADIGAALQQLGVPLRADADEFAGDAVRTSADGPTTAVAPAEM